MGDVGLAVDGGGDREDGSHDAQGHEDERASVDEHALAADLVHEHDARDDADDLEARDQQGLGQGHRLGEADRREQGVGVEEHPVDAGELLERGDRHTDEDEAAPLRGEDLPDRELGAARGGQGVRDGGDARGRVLFAADRLEHRLGLLRASHRDEVARRLGNCRRENDEEERRDDEAGEEDLPGHETGEGRLGGATGDGHDAGVNEAREEQAEDDGQLSKTDEAAADVGRGDLGDIAGSDRRCRAEADAADDAGHEQEWVAEAAQEGRDRAEEGLEEEEGADPHEGRLAADLVGDASCGERADEAANDARRAGHSLENRAELEGGADCLDGCVEDHALEAVEEGAEGCDERQPRGVAPRLLLAGCECQCR